MNFGQTSLFELASQRLQWLSDRQRVVSQNIANADVSGYKARNVESFEAYLSRADGADKLPSAEVVKAETQWGSDMTGNNVVLEDQILQARTAAGEYRMAAALYRKAHDMMLAVAGRR